MNQLSGKIMPNHNIEIESIRNSIISFLGGMGNHDKVNELVQVPIKDLDQFIQDHFGINAYEKIAAQVARYKDLLATTA